MQRTICVAYTLLITVTAGAAEHNREQIEFFERRIRPVLVEHCYSCHNSSNEAAGSLALDHRKGLIQGGDSGPIIVPGKPKKSRLLAILRHEVPGLKMPQDGAKFEPAVIADFARWIEMGAIDPRDAPPSATELAHVTSWESTFTKRRKWWSFQPVKKPQSPKPQDQTWSSHPVDQFLLATMEANGLRPSSHANKRTLLRRVSFVLTGLPPTVDEIKAFLADDSPKAYENVVDRLLDSPRFGERWARHWMDLVRYSESHGSQGDPELANAYRYRDYLIRAFNGDVPYDQLVREHIAGDLLPKPRWNVDRTFNESAIGTAHLRMVELGFVPVDALEDQVKVVDNQIDVYSKAFLGLTASCARCHNHKFDPISQEDFYALYGIFVSGRPGQVLIDAPELLDKHRQELASLKEKIRGKLADAWASAATQIGKRLQSEIGRSERLAELRRQFDANTKSVAAIEEPARAVVLRRRSKQKNPNAGASLPTAYARWSFDGDANDRMGRHHGQLLDGAIIRNGRLVLDGKRSSMRTSPLHDDISEKTLEAWVSLANFTQRGIGVVGLDTPGDQTFDSIVFGERTPKHWMAGSDYFRRTDEPGGIEETTPPDQLIHMVIVYAKDNSITLYRNGVPYGNSYTKGKVQPFIKGKSRFLFGQRLSGVNPPLAGEIEEARVYRQALNAAEVAASFEAGPEGVSTEELLAVLTADQRKQLRALHKTRDQLRAELQKLDPTSGENADPWVKAFEDARANKENPLHMWVPISTNTTLLKANIQQHWQELVEFWQTNITQREQSNEAKHKLAWDMRGNDSGQWFGYGSAFSAGHVVPQPHGAFTIEATGDRIIKGVHSAGVFSNGLSDKHSAVFTSPRFVVESNAISVRAFGRNARVRLVIENYPRGNGGIYPAATLNSDKFGWIVLNANYRIGQHAYLQFETNLTDRAYFGVDRIVTSDDYQPPAETIVPITYLLQGETPASFDELSERYAQQLQRAIQSWKSGAATAPQIAFLDFFVRRGLLPTTVSTLPELSESIKQYRQLEEQIPIPRRAPGLIETAGYDQPMFVRGQHKKPGSAVPRRGLSLFSNQPFRSKDSGRLKLAEQTASANNPLTARVMVNRLWHYVFGQGIVATVDNFGHLGKQPTHPELLDDLAFRFVESDWSIKKMLRLLVTSRAFQQTSQASDAALRIDPQNAILSHMPVRRLDADAIRDSMLATSGQLDSRMYGFGVNVYFTTKTEGGGPKGPLDGDRRRSVYLRIRRNAHNPFLEAFDAPKPTTTRGRRDVTNVPAQSLTMLNDPFVIDQAAKWAKQIIATHNSPTQRISNIYERAFARSPTDLESKALQEYVSALNKEHAASKDSAVREQLVWQDVAHAMFCLKEFIYVE